MLGDWQEKERRFHLGQALAKAELRIRAGRGDPFDWLIVNTAAPDSDITTIFDDDPVKLLMDHESESGLMGALEEHRELERDPGSLNYIDALLALLQDNEEELSTPAGDSRALHAVKDDIKALLEGKTVSDLLRLEHSIRTKLSGPGPLDPEYWQGLLTHLSAYKGRALVRETGRLLADRRKGRLGERAQCLTAEDWGMGGRTPVVGPEDRLPPTPSPVPSSGTSEGADELRWDAHPRAVALYETEARAKAHKDEIPFNTEAEDAKTTPAPPSALFKPRYYNYVCTCYDWNKYNQTHYDAENPPPKTIQGYRFTILYPRLPASAPAPTYKLEADPHDPDMRLIRFVGGGPYEELVFRIVREEWDMSHRQDFSCTYQEGVLRLQFWFKSQRYKR